MEQLNFNDISYLIGIVLSLSSEHIPQIKAILDQYTPKQRFFAHLAVVLIVVIVINWMSCYDLAIYECLDWRVLGDALTAWGIGQVFHWSQKGIV